MLNNSERHRLKKLHSVPVYRQLEANDCGPTCVQMIAAYYGKRYPLKTLKELCDMTRIGISLRDVVHCFEVIGFDVASVTMKLEEARRMPLPSVIYFKQGHFVVLDKISERNGEYEYRIIDPAYGRVKMTEETFADKWMSGGWGVGVVMMPTERFGDMPAGEDDERHLKSNMHRTAKIMFRSNRRNMIWIALLTMFVVATNWAMPLLLKTTIDDGILKKDIGIVWSMLIAAGFQSHRPTGGVFAGHLHGIAPHVAYQP